MKILLVVFSITFSLSAFADRTQIRCEGTKFNVSDSTLQRSDLIPLSQDRDFWTTEIDDVSFSVDFIDYEKDQVLTLFIMDKRKDFSSISREPFRADLGGFYETR